MSPILENIIPRIRRATRKVELREILVDRIWTLFSEENEQIDYEFERNGSLVITKGGESFDGSWRILGSGRLKIETPIQNIVLAHDSSVNGILLLKINGKENSPFLAFDNNILNDKPLMEWVKILEESYEIDNVEDTNEKIIETENEDQSSSNTIYQIFISIIIISFIALIFQMINYYLKK